MRETENQKLEKQEPGEGPSRKLLQIGQESRNEGQGQDSQKEERRVPRRRIPSGRTNRTEAKVTWNFSSLITGEQWCLLIKPQNSRTT